MVQWITMVVGGNYTFYHMLVYFWNSQAALRTITPLTPLHGICRPWASFHTWGEKNLSETLISYIMADPLGYPTTIPYGCSLMFQIMAEKCHLLALMIFSFTKILLNSPRPSYGSYGSAWFTPLLGSTAWQHGLFDERCGQVALTKGQRQMFTFQASHLAMGAMNCREFWWGHDVVEIDPLNY